MCGICGIIDKRGVESYKKALTRMQGLLAHRGPDGEGSYQDAKVALAHRRLAIIDPDTGHQPMIDPEDGCVIVYNGEVYNYLELKDELKTHGYRFETASDTEVVLKSFRRWGVDSLKRFNGMFAFAIYDPNKEALFLARDRLGKKPLYYFDSGGVFYFSSELYPLVESLPIARKIDGTSLYQYLRFQYIHSPRTIFSGVSQLAPAHYLYFKVGEEPGGQRCYWDVEDFSTFKGSEERALEELKALIWDAVRLRLRSDVDFGVFLSGGIDSTLVTWAMTELLAERPRSFSIGFSEDEMSELPYANEVARMLGTSHATRVLTPETVDVTEVLIKHFGEPFADSSALPTYFVNNTAKGTVKMALSGDGGDESFSGYGGYREAAKYRWLNPLCRLLPEKLFSKAPLPIKKRYQVWSRGIKDFHTANMSIIPEDELKTLLRADFLASGVSRENPFSPLYAKVKDLDPVTVAQYVDLKSYLPGDILTKVDRMSMANSIELRSPFLDYRVVEKGFSLPVRFRFGSLGRKHILKRILLKRFPERLVLRKKHGFGVPIHHWFKGERRDWFVSEFRRGKETIGAYFNPKEIDRLLDTYLEEGGYVSKLWAIYIFLVWHRTVMGG